jgi:lysyl-tRNA synthetase class 2
MNPARGEAGGSWRPGASRQAIERRATLLADIRAFFSARGVLEVETPLLSRAGNSDPNIACIATEEPDRRFLRTSPEYAMKRLLAAGQQDIYELGRVFRGGESGRHHNPEFTLLEWYRCGLGYRELATEVLQLIRHCGRGAFDAWSEQWLSYRDLFRQGVGLDPFFCSESDLADCAAERGIRAGPLQHLEWLDLLLAEILQPALPGECLTVIHDFPPEQAALARVRDSDPPVAERFEVFLGQVELANGYQELTDPAEQRRRFERENRLREVRGEDAVPLDERLLEALAHGLPDCSGVALGVDRLLLGLLGLDHIDTVLAFGNDRA